MKSNQRTDIDDEIEEIETKLDDNTRNELATSRLRNNYKQFGRPDNAWNDFSKVSKKNIDHVVTEKIIERDEKAVELIKKKIIKEDQEEKIYKDF